MSTEHHLTPRENFYVLRDEITSEQEFYWTRFSGFATLHAGLLVLFTSDTNKIPILLSAAAVVLGLVWWYVQRASLFYVNRYKSDFIEASKQVNFQYKSHDTFSQKGKSTTDVAMIVPIVLTILWVLLLIITVSKYFCICG
jgi:hypothetical protein